jgi:predicted nucleotidyltransferase
MIDERFKPPIIDFIDRAKEIPNLVGIVLFGSAVTGDISKKSDIDLLLIFDSDHNPEIGMESEIAHRIASDISLKRDLTHPFSFVFVNQRNMKEIELDFLWNVVRDGILIWGRAEDVIMKRDHPSLEPMVIIRYSMKELSEKDKRRLLRYLYSSKRSMVDKKTERLGPGTLLLKAEKFDGVKDVLDSFGIRYSVRKIWGH